MTSTRKTVDGIWVSPDIRDALVDDVAHWQQRTEIPAKQVLLWLGTAS